MTKPGIAEKLVAKGFQTEPCAKNGCCPASQEVIVTEQLMELELRDNVPTQDSQGIATVSIGKVESESKDTLPPEVLYYSKYRW